LYVNRDFCPDDCTDQARAVFVRRFAQAFLDAYYYCRRDRYEARSLLLRNPDFWKPYATALGLPVAAVGPQPSR
jgi:hypothetical protein